MSKNKLKLNDDKTELLIVSSKNAQSKIQNKSNWLFNHLCFLQCMKFRNLSEVINLYVLHFILKLESKESFISLQPDV